MTPLRATSRPARARRAAVAVDRALRRAGRARARACSISPAGTAATRASSPRAAARVVAVDRDRGRARDAWPASPRIETRALDLEAGHLALARRALRRDRRRQLPASAAVAGAARRRSPTTASCSTRRSRAATRPTAARRIRTSCSRPASCCGLVARTRSPWSRSSRAVSRRPSGRRSSSGSWPSDRGGRGRRRCGGSSADRDGCPGFACGSTRATSARAGIGQP